MHLNQFSIIFKMSQLICIYQCKLTYFSQKVKCRYYTEIGWLFPKSVHYSLASLDDNYLLNYFYLILFDPPVDPFQLL